MQLKFNRSILARGGFTGVTIAVSGVLFVIILEALYRFIRVRSHMASAAATFAIVIMGIVELSFIIYSGEVFRKQRTIGLMFIAFLRVISILALLFALLQVFELWTYIPNPAHWMRSVGAVWKLGDYAYFVGGIVISIGSYVFARMLETKRRRSVAK